MSFPYSSQFPDRLFLIVPESSNNKIPYHLLSHLVIPPFPTDGSGGGEAPTVQRNN